MPTLREQLAALFGRGEQAPQQPDSALVAQIPGGAPRQPSMVNQVPTGAPGEQLDTYGQVVDEDALGAENEEAFITRQNEDLVNRPAGRPSVLRRAPVQSGAELDELMMQLANPDRGITEGPNANIGDDSRARALAQVAALRG